MFVSTLCNHNIHGSMLSTANRTTLSNEVGYDLWMMWKTQLRAKVMQDFGDAVECALAMNTVYDISNGQFFFINDPIKDASYLVHSELLDFCAYVLLRRRNPIATPHATMMQWIINYVFVHLICCYISILFKVHIDDNAIHMLLSHTNYLSSQCSNFCMLWEYMA